VYWFSYALNADQAAREAQQCLSIIKPYKVEYPICFDLEYDTIRYASDNGVTIGKALSTAFVKAFCTAVEQAGYYAMNYTNQDYIRNMLDMDALSGFDLWYAWYNANCNRDDAGLWQYTSSGKVPGINGNVDLNIAFKDYPAIIKSAGLNGFSNGQPIPPTPTPSDSAPTTPEQKESSVPQWQHDGFTKLVAADIIDSPEYWLPKLKDTITVGEIFGILGKMCK
jgi:hypothetical protein